MIELVERRGLARRVTPASRGTAPVHACRSRRRRLVHLLCGHDRRPCAHRVLGGVLGDTDAAPGQLLTEELDYLVADYLSEITMALLARARAKDPEGGFVAAALEAGADIVVTGPVRSVPLRTLAWGRSGDKVLKHKLRAEYEAYRL